MKIRWMIVPIVAVIGLSLAFAACGGDDNSSASSTATATAGATNTPEPSATHKATATAKNTATPKKTATPKNTATPGATGASINDSTPQINECEIIDLANLTAAAGDKFTKAGTLNKDICTFEGDNATRATIATHDLSAYGSSVKDIFESIPVVFGDDILSSPGDEAYYDQDTGLSVLSRNIELDVEVTKPDGTHNRDAAFAIAGFVVPKLP